MPDAEPLASGDPASTSPYTPMRGFVPPTPADLTRHFPQLEIIELVGQGGMGAVYKARQPSLDRMVALKILPPGVGQDPAFAERFSREARALAKLSHQNIVTIHDFGQAGGLFYFVMEFVDGANLRQLLHTGKLEPRQALAIVPQICDALQYAHDEGVVHRDIKPENILLDKKGRAKIADFGLAKLLGRAISQQPDSPDSPVSQERLTYSGQVMGTPHYMAPEQVERPLTVDHRADIYSLGVVFYEMLTGELPLGRFALPSQKVEVDVRLDAVVLRALEKEPERRYQHASDVKTDVEGISKSPQPQAEPAACAHDPTELEMAEARDQVRLTAIGLMITGIIQTLLGAGILLAAMRGPHYTGRAHELIPVVVVTLLSGLAMAPMIIIGALKMMRLTSPGWALAAGMLAILPCSPIWVLGLPMGIWSLVVLSRRNVKAAFRGRLRQTKAVPAACAHAPTELEMEEARHQVRGPAIGLLIAGIMQPLLFFWGTMALARLIGGLVALANPKGFVLVGVQPSLALPLLAVLSVVGIGATIILGALKMMRLTSRGWAIAASMLAMLPWTVIGLLGLPMGIWSLVVLNRPNVKAVFRGRSRQDGQRAAL